MQNPKEQELVTLAAGNKGTTHRGSQAQHPISSQGEEVTSVEQLNSEEFHSLLDATMTKSVTQALGAMSDNLTQSISNAIMASGHNPKDLCSKAQDDKPAPFSGHKTTEKTHHMGKQTSKTTLTDRLCPVTDEDVGPPRKRASRWAKNGEDMEMGKNPERNIRL
ncbi:Hypothetical predicted protein [Pelobates cultripes]|uniref:Uncharacterized protein n=1 Tax=Pelobates cultripes TaxID=61616 RepID=A0AAD1RS53_PELCU|nr:Hypothetical predicted protein [Pelobates cultripes]